MKSHIPHLNTSTDRWSGTTIFIDYPGIDHFNAVTVFLKVQISPQRSAEITEERATFCNEFSRRFIQIYDDLSVSYERIIVLAVEAIPVTLRCVTFFIAISVCITAQTVLIEFRITFALMFRAIKAVEQTFDRVAFLIAAVVVEHIPASDGVGAVLERIRSEGTVSSIEATCRIVAFFVTNSILSFMGALVPDAGAVSFVNDVYSHN